MADDLVIVNGPVPARLVGRENTSERLDEVRLLAMFRQVGIAHALLVANDFQLRLRASALRTTQLRPACLDLAKRSCSAT